MNRHGSSLYWQEVYRTAQGLCWFCTLFIAQALYSQQPLDSLLIELQHAEKNHIPDQKHPKLLNDIARGIFMRSPDSAKKLASRALAAAGINHDSAQIATAHNIFGLVHLDKALYQAALDELLIALRLHELRRDTLAIAKVLSNIGNVYGRQNQYERALEVYHQALKLYESISNLREQTGPNTNIGFTFWKQGKYDSALPYHYRALGLAQALNLPEKELIARVNLGATYLGKHQFDSAHVYLLDAERMSTMQKNNRALCLIYYYQGQLAEAEGRNRDATRLAEESLALARKLGSREEQQNTLKLLADIFGKEGRYREAFEYERRYTALKDSLFNVDNTKALAALQALYTTEKKDKEISALRYESERQTLESEQQKMLRNSLGAGLVFVALLALVVTNRFIIKRRAAEDLARKNAEILHQQHILEDQAAEIEIANTQLQEANLKLLDANDELQQSYRQIVQQQKILEAQAADIQEHSTQLQESNVELQRLNNEKTEFLGIVVHDLKNPLTSMLLSAQNLKMYSHSLKREQIIQMAERSIDVISRMREIIDDVLDIHALESGLVQVHLSAFDVVSVIEPIVEEYRSIAETKDITIGFTASETRESVLADAKKVAGVFDNLLSNAVKYSPQGKKITVVVQSRNGAVCIGVADEGPGISEEDMKKLFGKFARLSARPTGGEHSTGLGLSIVKKMVEAMNGRVWCESELGKGATFMVELPFVSQRGPTDT